MSFRAIFTSFDHFMAMFVALFGVFASTAFMPLLGGPLHTYESRAIGAGWHSLRSGEATTLSEAFEIATSLPAEAVFPSAHAQELPLQIAREEADADPMELLGGPELPPVVVLRPTGPRIAAAVTPVTAQPMVELEISELQPSCGVPAMKRSQCITQAADASI